MAKRQMKPGNLLAPLPPTIVTCGTPEKPNALTVAWTGTRNTKPPKTYISVRPTRYSYNLIKESGEFVINLTTEKLIRAADYIGCRTGAKEDKLKNCGLTVSPARTVSAPILNESPVNIECRVTDVISLGSHDMFIADIVGIDVDDALFDENDRLALEKAGLAAYVHGEYYALGKRLGTFGYSVKKKKTKKKVHINGKESK